MPRDGAVVVLGWTAPNGITMCQSEFVKGLKQGRPSVENITRIGMDTSKSVFQLHGVNAAEQPVLRKKLTRSQMIGFFENLAPTTIAMALSEGWSRLSRADKGRG
jgi:transposase